MRKVAAAGHLRCLRVRATGPERVLLLGGRRPGAHHLRLRLQPGGGLCGVPVPNMHLQGRSRCPSRDRPCTLTQHEPCPSCPAVQASGVTPRLTLALAPL